MKVWVKACAVRQRPHRGIEIRVGVPDGNRSSAPPKAGAKIADHTVRVFLRRNGKMREKRQDALAEEKNFVLIWMPDGANVVAARLFFC